MDTIRAYAERLAIKSGKALDLNFLNAFEADILSTRAFLIARMNQSLRTLPETYINTISCVPLKTVSGMECAGIPILKGAEIVKRTTSRIPKPVTTLNRESLVSVSYTGTVNTQVALLTVEESEFKEYRRFTFDAPYCMLINDYIYTVNYKPDKIKFRIVAEDPLKVAEFSQTIQQDLATEIEGCSCCGGSENKDCFNNDFSNCVSPLGELLIEKSLGASIMAYILGGGAKN